MRVNIQAIRQMISKPALSAVLSIGVQLLLCSCAGTSIKQTWKSPEFKDKPSGSVAVIAVDERTLLRQGFENRFVRQLKEAGQPALTTFELLALPKIKEDKQAAAGQLREAGAGGVLILRLVDMSTRFRDIRGANDRFVPYISGFDSYSFGWYDYYSVGFMNMSTSYGAMKRDIYLESSLFDLKTEKLLWSGITQTVLKDGMDGLVQMDAVVHKVVKAMRKDDVIQ